MTKLILCLLSAVGGFLICLGYQEWSDPPPAYLDNQISVMPLNCKPDKPMGNYQPYMIDVDGRKSKVADYPTESDDVWLFQIGKHIQVHAVRVKH